MHEFQSDSLFDVLTTRLDGGMATIARKVRNGERISTEEAVKLYEEATLGTLGILAEYGRQRLNENKVYFNRNFHLEPTNICMYNCLFCSYSRKENEEGSWELTREDVVERINRYKEVPITEIHIVGGVHPSRDIHYYADLLGLIKSLRPDLHVKAFTAVELDYMIRKAGMSLSEGLVLLKESGLDSIPGGGAEIFDEGIRNKVCGTKTSSERWLQVHHEAHKLGIPSNATMLYGHYEEYGHRVDHMNRLRKLQDQTGGFNAFIPLKYRSANNALQSLGEVSTTEDLRNYAVARIFLDNIPHLKAYWPMIGKEVASLSLSFGVDDLDGTIDDSTKIYSMAGAEEQSPSMTTAGLVDLIRNSGRVPVERDSIYRNLMVFDKM
jgi:aminodeoxyfutalosine synthase